jgi:hypothetical protein
MSATRVSSALVALACFGIAGCDSGDEPASSNPEVLAGCTSPGTLAAPSMPANLMPPAQDQLFLRLRATGSQIYACQQGMDGSWAFALKAPDARLYDDQCRVVGTHFAGPTWAITADSSQVAGKKAAEAPAPGGGAVPWLLLSATSSSASGMLAGVSYIQRVETAGGLAPASGCDAGHAGVEVAVPYTATYLYYRGQ